MIVLVTGASGRLGYRVAERLIERAHAVRAMTRSPANAIPVEATAVRADLGTGAGLPDAVDGVDAIVHCATDPRAALQVDDRGTAKLIELAERSGRPHLVFPSIVGCDVIPGRYCSAKLVAEGRVEESELPWTISRFTQFHESIWAAAERRSRAPVVLAPASTWIQPLDTEVAALRLVDAVEVGPAGRLPDLGGRQAFEAKALIGSYLAATARRRLVLAVNYPGIRGAVLRAGGLLTENKTSTGDSWNDFVAQRLR